MSKLCTTIEQSKKLIELGIDRNTADMSYSSIHNIGQEVSYCNVPLWVCPMADDIPAWSLSSLFDLFPNGSILRKSDKGKYFMFGNMFDNPLDAAFEMVVWLKENGKI